MPSYKLLIRNLTPQATLEDIQNRLGSDLSVNAQILWFEAGTTPSRGLPATPGWCSIRVTEQKFVERVAAAFDGIVIGAAVDKQPYTAAVEYAPFPQSSILGVAGQRGTVSDSDMGNIFESHDYLSFMKELEEGKTATPGQQTLEEWVAEHNAAQAAPKTTALVNAVVGNWFYGKAFPWEEERKKSKSTKEGEDETKKEMRRIARQGNKESKILKVLEKDMEKSKQKAKQKREDDKKQKEKERKAKAKQEKKERQKREKELLASVKNSEVVATLEPTGAWASSPKLSVQESSPTKSDDQSNAKKNTFTVSSTRGSRHKDAADPEAVTGSPPVRLLKRPQQPK